jgi:hypothetical protein
VDVAGNAEDGEEKRMTELTISLYVVCVGFIAGLWEREHQREPLGGQENQGLNQTLKAALRTDGSSSESEDPGPGSDIARITSSARATVQANQATRIGSDALNGHKEVEFDDKGK